MAKLNPVSRRTFADAKDLDPGVHRLVCLLYGAGYDTCDSGDGKSKFQDPRNHTQFVRDYPHVFIQCSRASLPRKLDEVRKLLEDQGVDFSDPAPGSPEREWLAPSPSVDGLMPSLKDKCFIEISHVTDGMLRED